MDRIREGVNATRAGEFVIDEQEYEYLSPSYDDHTGHALSLLDLKTRRRFESAFERIADIRMTLIPRAVDTLAYYKALAEDGDEDAKRALVGLRRRVVNLDESLRQQQDRLVDLLHEYDS